MTAAVHNSSVVNSPFGLPQATTTTLTSQPATVIQLPSGAVATAATGQASFQPASTLSLTTPPPELSSGNVYQTTTAAADAASVIASCLPSLVPISEPSQQQLVTAAAAIVPPVTFQPITATANTTTHSIFQNTTLTVRKLQENNHLVVSIVLRRMNQACFLDAFYNISDNKIATEFLNRR